MTQGYINSLNVMFYFNINLEYLLKCSLLIENQSIYNLQYI